MRVARATVGLLGAVLLVAGGAPPPATAADPPGTTLVNAVPTMQATAVLSAASPAGVLYAEHAPSLPVRRWFKPAGAEPPREVWTGYYALEGRLLFGSPDDSNVRWQDVGSGHEQACPSPGTSTLYTSTGWISWTWNPTENRTTYWRTTVSGDACSDRLLGTLPSYPKPVAANADGFALTEPSSLWWVANDDLGSRVAIDTGQTDPTSVQVEGSALSWTDSASRSHRLYRASTSGGATVVTEIDQSYQVVTRLTATHTAFTVGSILGTVPAAGGAPTTRTVGWVTGSLGGVASDGTWFYFVSPDGRLVQRARSAADQPETVLTMPLRPAGSADLGLGPGRVATTNFAGTGSPRAVRRTLTQGVPPVVGGASADLGEANEGSEFNLPIGTEIEQDGRRTAWLGPDGWIRLATEGGATVRIPFPEPRGEWRPWGENMMLSGSRLLWSSIEVFLGDTPNPPHPRNAYLYDVRTGVSTLLGSTRGSDYALWGNYLVHAQSDGTITRKDLSTGTVVTVKGPGGWVRSVDAHGSWVAWTMCSDAFCTSATVSHRNVNAGALPYLVATTDSRTVRLTNNFLYYDAKAADSHRVVRRLTLGTAAPVDTGLVDVGDFDAHDETLGWVGADDRARVAPQPAFSARPRFLGGSLGAAGFTPNGDGKADTWPVEFPLTKPLPTCAITIRLGTTVVRTLNCANTNGAAAATWDGRNTAGKLVAKARYTWTLTGSDADGALLLWNGSSTAYSGTVTVS